MKVFSQLLKFNFLLQARSHDTDVAGWFFFSVNVIVVVGLTDASVSGGRIRLFSTSSVLFSRCAPSLLYTVGDWRSPFVLRLTTRTQNIMPFAVSLSVHLSLLSHFLNILPVTICHFFHPFTLFCPLYTLSLYSSVFANCTVYIYIKSKHIKARNTSICDEKQADVPPIGEQYVHNVNS